MKTIRVTALMTWVLSTAAPVVAAQEGSPPPPPPIQDNSFLLEEAYNQEPGVVQHISLFSRVRGTGDWGYAFTQEWPAGGQRHQLSYTVTLARVAGSSGLGDLALNYRNQVAGDGRQRFALAPRASLVLPTGSAPKGLGGGGVGVEVNLPASFALGGGLVAHINLGGAVTPSARNPAGDRATVLEARVGQSLIWQVTPTVNLMVEGIWSRGGVVVSPGATAAVEEAWISPGIRGAVNFANGLQVVPGLAVAFGVGPSRGARLVLAYLSFEHPL